MADTLTKVISADPQWSEDVTVPSISADLFQEISYGNLSFTPDTVYKKQSLLSFSHLIDFKDIEEQDGSILLPKVTEILPKEFDNSESQLSSVKNVAEHFPKIDFSPSVISNQLYGNVSSLYAPSTLSHSGLLAKFSPTIVNTNLMTTLRRFSDQQLQSSAEDFRETLLHYLLQEVVLSPMSEIQQSTLIHIIQVLTVAMYFRKNVTDIVHAVASHMQFAPVRHAMLEFKEHLAAQLACGTAIVTLGDIFDGTVSDVWLSLGCLAILISKSKIEKHLTSSLNIEQS